jgi:hypothetical protein
MLQQEPGKTVLVLIVMVCQLAMRLLRCLELCSIVRHRCFESMIQILILVQLVLVLILTGDFTPVTLSNGYKTPDSNDQPLFCHKGTRHISQARSK